MRTELKAAALEKYYPGISKEGENVNRKAFTADWEFSDADDMSFIARVSTPKPDADGDIVWSMGADLTRFLDNPVLLWSHKHDEAPIGKITDIRCKQDGIYVKGKLADTYKGKDYWKLVKGGFLKTHSIGYLPKKILLAGTSAFSAFASKYNLVTTGVKRIIADFVLLEDSLCSIPCNPEALTVAISTKSLVIGKEVAGELGVVFEEPIVEPVKEEVTPEVAPIVASTDAPITILTPDSTIVIEPKIEPTPEVITTVIIEPIPEPVVEPIVVPKPEVIWTVIREGDYVITEEESKSLKLGRII